RLRALRARLLPQRRDRRRLSALDRPRLDRRGSRAENPPRAPESRAPGRLDAPARKVRRHSRSNRMTTPGHYFTAVIASLLRAAVGAQVTWAGSLPDRRQRIYSA